MSSLENGDMANNITILHSSRLDNKNESRWNKKKKKTVIKSQNRRKEEVKTPSYIVPKNIMHGPHPIIIYLWKCTY